MGAIRGATTAQNNREDIIRESQLLVEQLLKQNDVDASNVDAVFCSVTKELTAFNPVTAIRQYLNAPNVAYMCFAEAQFDANYLPNCIRVCIFARNVSQSDVKHCYLNDAKNLRPDLNGKS